MRKELKKGFGMLVGLVLVFVLAACGTQGQQNDGKKLHKIGIAQIADHPSLDNCRTGFIAGLEEAGLVMDQDFEIDVQSAQNDPNIATQIAQKFAADKKSLVCGIATPTAQALYASCFDKGIPVIFNAISDPVEAKLAISETEPMEGITGVSDSLPVERQLQLIRAILPEAKKIGILYTTSEPNSISTLKTYQVLAPQYGFEIEEKGIVKQAEVPAAMDVLVQQVDCISNMTDNTVVAALGVVLDKARAAGKPVFGSEEEQVKNGCLASAGLNYFDLGKQAGAMAAKILNGAEISTIPYETVKDVVLTVNQTTADALGITVPDTILAEADVVA